MAWIRARKKAGIADFRVHDLRHISITRLFERANLSAVEAASVSGHRTASQLARYTHLQTSHLIAKMDEAEAVAKAKEAAIATAKQTAIESSEVQS
jgi:integrase